MATATTPEHVETHNAPIAEKPPRVEVRKVAIDGNTLSVLAVGIALFALAFGAFTHLSGRIEGVEAKLSGRMDSLDTKIDKVATELRGDIKEVNAKVDKLSVDLNAKIERVDAKIDAVNARLDRLFELIASQGRRDTQ